MTVNDNIVVEIAISKVVYLSCECWIQMNIAVKEQRKVKEKIKIGIVGLGARGEFLLKLIAEMEDIEVVLCDLISERVDSMKALYKEISGRNAEDEPDYQAICARDDVDAVMMLGTWESHIEIAVAAMESGKYAAIEVGGCFDLQECYKLVETYEKTKMPCMMLENCCYGRREMMALNLKEKGLFGEIVHCAGGYMHDCRKIMLEEVTPLRLLENAARNAEIYPTHELGPIAKVLGINRGNKFLSLVSMSSSGFGLREYCKKSTKAQGKLDNIKVNQGDIVNTTIKCINGETISLTLDMTLPRPYYSRNFTVRGTKGMYSEERKVLFFDSMDEDTENNEEEMFKQYDHPLWNEYIKNGIMDGHDGIDFLVLRAFFESVKRGTNTPIDAYDTASWMAISVLSEQSIAMGSAPVPVPDFTKGKWINRESVCGGKFCLDKVCTDKNTSIC